MKAARGFTLVEILVALTLFAVVGGALLQLFHSGLKNARVAEERGHAALLARSLLTELQVYATLSPGELSGDFPDGYRWRARLTPSVLPEGLQSTRLLPLDLELVISWGDDTDPQSFVLHSLLLSREPPS